MSEHTCNAQLSNPSLILHIQAGNQLHPVSPSYLAVVWLPLISLSRCQWLVSVSDVTTCCDQARSPGGYLGIPGHSVIRHLAQSLGPGM